MKKAQLKVLFGLLFASTSLFGQLNLVQPVTITGTATLFTPASTPEDAVVDPIVVPLTDPTSTTVSSYSDGSGFNNVYIWNLTANTITMDFSPAVNITGVAIWNAFASGAYLDPGFLEPDHSVALANFEFFDGGVSLGDEDIDVLFPDDAFGELYPFIGTYDNVDQVVMTVLTNHGGNETAMQEIAFNTSSCDNLTTSISSTDICIGDELTLEATSENGGIISWDGGVVNGVPFVPAAAGEYTYTATSDNEDDCDFSVDIIVHELPTINAVAFPPEICLGETVLFGGTGGETYEWDLGVVNGVPYEPLSVGISTYTVIGTDEFGCQNTDEVDILVGAPPIVDFEFVVDGVSSEDGSTGGCILNPVQFNDLSTIIDPDEIVEWDWDFGDGGSSGAENPEHTYGSSGTYTVTLTVESESGCTASYSLVIIMTEGLSVEISFNEPTCNGFSDGSLTINVLGGLEDLTFEITNDLGEILNEDNSNTANTLPSGTYYYTVSDGSACDAEGSIFIDQPSELDIDITIQDPLCFGDKTGWATVNEVFNATGDYDEISYIWNPNPAGVGGTFADSSYNMGAGDYTLTINDDNGCSKVFDFEVNQPDSLYFSQFGFEPAYCRLHEYQNGNGVVFGAAAGGTADYDYLWTNLETGATINNTTWGGRNPGNYKLTVIDENGCVLERTVFLDSLNPIASFTVTSDQLNNDLKGTGPVDVLFTNTSENFANPNNPTADTTFFWNLNNPIAEWQVTHDYFELFDTTYGITGESYTVDVCLVAINKNGCADTACKIITIYEPLITVDINVFTPNGDGINDAFTFEFLTNSVDEFTCVIVNRWGVKIHELNQLSDSWDGNDKGGNPCKDGVYFYSYAGKSDDGTVIEGQGSLQLIRGN